MRQSLLSLAAAACIAIVDAAPPLKTLANVCTTSFVTSALPLDVSAGIVIDPTSVTANAYLGYSVTGNSMQPNATFDFCNVTFSYSHPGKNDYVLLQFWLPAPQDFENRYLSTGGGGNAINSGNSGLQYGVPYGAVSGLTSGGLGPADNVYTNFLYANGSIDYDIVYMFGYSAHHELAIVGKALSKNFYGMGSTKLYSYYDGCSEGGREGMSQVQRFEDQFDGAIIGAPAIRYAFQQVQHLFSGVAEKTLNTFPSNCVFQFIVNETIAACDPLDGLTDGVVARSDLCSLHFDLSTIVGKTYSCPAQPAKSFPPTPAQGPQNGTITKKDVTLAKTIINGLHDSSGKRVYFSYQPGAGFTDAQTTYNASSNSWYAQVSGIGGSWVAEAILEEKISSLPSLTNITYDTLRDWISTGLQKYYDSLETDWPDLTPYHSGGGKILHYHGESDDSIPTASSVRFFESVRSTMYPGMSVQNGAAALGDWYRLFLVPGAAHCSPNSLQPNGPFPQTNFQVMINWVEKNVEPTTLTATHLAGPKQGQTTQICAWPTRPLWTNNGATMECVFDQASYNSWTYNLNAIKMPVY